MIMKTENEILNALANYCSQTERCLFDVRKKMQGEDLPKEAEKRIVDRLLQEKFIDEKRFCRSFVHDKFQLNHWGRIKIAYELRARDILPAIYYEAIEAIDEDEYITVLKNLLINKKRTVQGRSPQDVYQKLARFAAARGFETPLIAGVLKKMFKHSNDD